MALCLWRSNQQKKNTQRLSRNRGPVTWKVHRAHCEQFLCSNCAGTLFRLNLLQARRTPLTFKSWSRLCCSGRCWRPSARRYFVGRENGSHQGLRRVLSNPIAISGKWCFVAMTNVSLMHVEAPQGSSCIIVERRQTSLQLIPLKLCSSHQNNPDG